MKFISHWKTIFLAVAVLMATPIYAQPVPLGPDAASRLVAEGQIRTLDQILRGIDKQKIGGRLIAAELERSAGKTKRHQYRLQFRNRQGKVITALVDAKTGKVIKRPHRAIAKKPLKKPAPKPKPKPKPQP